MHHSFVVHVSSLRRRSDALLSPTCNACTNSSISPSCFTFGTPPLSLVVAGIETATKARKLSCVDRGLSASLASSGIEPITDAPASSSAQA
eukprot:CAMPEP_0118937648 /NCGR_PEP_ID=MMETSP1169-20130426/23387_1 /TAXON_ID=36882 /ORGANISM="Pyramimonas obovata, Strain CCMP722" /LENGTH=90 /DNA_ID=CAMNT_0006881349 /DNA_START=51 /DNA_END=320 /DNA_ORIENTATION=+